jgi:hypothetical protein
VAFVAAPNVADATAAVAAHFKTDAYAHSNPVYRHGLTSVLRLAWEAGNECLTVSLI